MKFFKPNTGCLKKKIQQEKAKLEIKEFKVAFSCTDNSLLQVMSKEEKDHIKDLDKCKFTEYSDYFKMKSEERKAMSKEDKKVGLRCQTCFLDLDDFTV